MRRLSWIFRLTAAGILLQTLFFKFTGAPESVHIFTTLGVEPAGRVLSGLVELIAAIVLLTPVLHVYGALLASAVMVSAVSAHIGVLGVDVMGDGGLLFALAWITLFASLGALWTARRSSKAPRLQEVTL